MTIDTKNLPIVNGLPFEMGVWYWQYTPGHGYNGRHAYSKANPELSLPYRQVLAIRKNPTKYETILDRSLARRDVILETTNQTFQHRSWVTLSYQFSTGVLRKIQELPNETYIMISVTGITTEEYHGLDNQDLRDEVVTRTVSGYNYASFLKDESRFIQRVIQPAYRSFDPIYYFTLHIQTGRLDK